MPRLSKIGAAALAAFGWTGGASVSASYLQVAGGGGGGFIAGGNRGAGGGAGGFLTGTVSLNPTLSYTVTVGAGGTPLANGSNSTITGTGISITASVGGGAGGSQNGASSVVGQNGGSGGGGPSQSGSGSNAAGTGTVGQGNDGAAGTNAGGQPFGCGGGGGAGAVGTLSNNPAGAGGVGLTSSITGTSTYYAGGGGGGTYAAGPGVGGAGGLGGGGTGGGSGGNSTSGTANLGGGGGGAEYSQTSGSSGGSGVVIISYVGAQQFGGGVVTSSGGSTIHTFNTSGTLSPLSSLTANFLVVAGGGGGGGAYGGGGGAGGLRSSVTNTGGGGSLESTLTIDTNSIYLVTVGAGGVGAQYTVSQANSGSNSAFLSITSIGGGRSGLINTAGASGGSGGGGGSASGTGAAGGSGTANQGFAGGTGAGYDGVNGYAGGGGGGAGAVGQSRTALQNTGGNGGAGVSVAITGSSVGYAGGGGGSGYTTSGGTATDGGGAGADYNVIGSSGAANKGGGGGGGGAFPDFSGNGGSGVVIISYPGSTQQMAGGTVTVAGGNVIHTFTSSGYLTPIVLVTNSLRFRKSASASLTRTPTAVGNTKTFTFSTWLKRGQISSDHSFFTSGNAAPNPRASFEFITATDALYISFNNGSGWVALTTSAVYRDPSAWYHIVVAVDTTQATASNRVKLYVNGSQVTAFSSATYPNQNDDTSFNTTVPQALGYYIPSPSQYFDGYMTEVYMIDGQALTPNSFGTFSGLGVWQPIRYGGSYGTNGFYLPFTNTTSTTTLGYDFSPQGNNWTTNNISLTAGTTYDSMTDVPTLTSATTANYCVLNPIFNVNGTNVTYSNGNLTFSHPANSGNAQLMAIRGTIALPAGKYYWEYTVGATVNDQVGIGNNVAFGGSPDGTAGARYLNSGAFQSNYTNPSSAASYTTNDIIGVAYDQPNGTLAFYKNNSLQGTITNISTTEVFFPSRSPSSSGTGGAGSFNFGQQPFAYTPPSGFVALNTFNLPTPTIGATASTTANKYFDATTYTGNGTVLGSTQTITNAGSFQPDLVWLKSRSNAQDNNLYDAVRGISGTGSPTLFSNLTDAETTYTGYGVSALNSNGFTLIGNGGLSNNNGFTYVGWQWRASNATGVTNTAGSITSTVSANTTAGFSIVTYTGTGSNATVGHGLGATPSMVIVKNRGGSYNWLVYHKFMATSSPATWYMSLNSTAAASNGANVWIDDPTSTVFTVSGSYPEVNGSANTYVAYCFAQVAGYSAFGSYTGNGSTDGPFVFTGFRPRYVMIKRTDAVQQWWITDTARNPSNTCNLDLFANLVNAEENNGYNLDLLSNGVKIRTSTNDRNASGGTYIYMAFAENPFKYANAR
jgi:hypothetical protein